MPETAVLKDTLCNTLFDVVVIGAGPAGLAAAHGALAGDGGAESVLVIDRDRSTGGILNQCIHDGFGLHRYNRVLTGPEYAAREKAALEVFMDSGVLRIIEDTFVEHIEKDASLFRLYTMSSGCCRTVSGKSVILAMGCRERTAGAISLPGTRPAGIFTAGTAQRLMNMQNTFVGKRAVIVGSGDIGLIMARRLTLEGAEVAAVTEIQPYPGGLDRNVRQCLGDFGIPLLLSTGIVRVHGKQRVEGITVAPLDSSGGLDRTREQFIACDTVLLSVGLIPEHELVRMIGADIDQVTKGPVVDQDLMTSVPGLFACGNVLQVHDLVDYVSEEAEAAGISAARWAAGPVAMDAAVVDTAHKHHGTRQEVSGSNQDEACIVIAGDNVRYALPQRITTEGRMTLSLRPTRPAEQYNLTVTGTTKAGSNLTIVRKKFGRVTPSEMIRVQLTIPEGLARLEVSGES